MKVVAVHAPAVPVPWTSGGWTVVDASDPDRVSHGDLHDADVVVLVADVRADPLGDARRLLALRPRPALVVVGRGPDLQVLLDEGAEDVVDPTGPRPVAEAVEAAARRHRARTASPDALDTIDAREAAVRAFVSLLSHDLRGPLATARGLAGMLHERRHDLDAGMVDDLLERLERVSGEVVETLEHLVADVREDLGAAGVVDVLEVLRASASDRRVAVEDLAPDEPVRVSGNPAPLRAALDLLLVPAAGVDRVAVEVQRASRTRTHVLLTGVLLPGETTARTVERLLRRLGVGVWAGTVQGRPQVVLDVATGSHPSS